MERDKGCYKCGIGFPQIGNVTSEERIREHEMIHHGIHCKECDRYFISSVHLKYHLTYNHDTKCNDCFSYCEQNCAEKYALVAETAGKEKMEKGLAEKKEATKDIEKDLKCIVKGVTYSHNEKLEEMAKFVDAGYSGREAQEWSHLLYLPFPLTPEEDVNYNMGSWIQLGLYEASVDEQIAKVNQIIIKKCHMLKCDQTFIDEWSHRWEWHPDSSSHRWEWHPDLFEEARIKRAANIAMTLVKDSALNDRDSATDKNRETEEARTYSSNIHMNKSAGTYGSLSPNLSLIPNLSLKLTRRM